MTTLLLSMAILAADPTITAAVGTGVRGYTGDGGPATKATLDNPFDVVFARNGDMYLSDTNNHVVRKVDAKTGVITTVAGSGKKGYTGDGGPAISATLNEPYGIAIDPAGDGLFIVDRLNFCIRFVDQPTGTIRTVAGNGKSGFAGDGGPADKAMLKEPNDICLFGQKLLIADVKDQRIRSVDLATRTMGTFAGTGERKTAGDDGPFEKASFAGPRAITSSADGHTLFVVEREGNCVRKIDRETGKITRFAGTGKKGFTGDGGPAVSATFDGPKEVAVGSNGNSGLAVYVVDTESEVIRRIDAATGVITTVAGKGRTNTPGLGDGGPALSAALGRPHGVAVGPDGAIYIGDTLSHRIRRVK